jgi:chromosome partitioning protein
MERNSPQKRISWSKFLDVLTEDHDSVNKRIVVERATETERLAIRLLRREGWSTQIVKNRQKDFEIELYKPGEKVAVKIRNQRAKVQLAQVEKFADLLNKQKLKFTKGYFISTNGFTPSVYTFLREEKIGNLKPVIMQDDQFFHDPEKIDVRDEKDKTIYIGVFTCKGGVGKTTISAHLAGAFALNGYNVALVDLDKQQNLRKLLGKSVNLPQSKGQAGSKISVLNSEEWDRGNFEDTKIVICDCSPEFDANPAEFLQKFDHCIVPTTLNPLGINKNADVIRRTFDAIRRENSRANLFVLINNLHTDEDRRNVLLNEKLKSQFEEIIKQDDFCHYISPHNVAIRFSKQLLYWGLHLFDETEPQLAFRSLGGYSYPRTDFLKLVDYLELHTKISKAKALHAKAG